MNCRPYQSPRSGSHFPEYLFDYRGLRRRVSRSGAILRPGRDVLFIEDIIDTGQTLKNLCNLFKERNAASVKIATLLDKPEGRVVDINADYTCFTIPNEFVVGYGLDYEEYYRNIPYVGVLKEEVYTK